MEPYARLRRNAAWVETKRFWNVHQIWKHFATPLTGATVGLIRMIWTGQPALLDSILTAFIWAVIFYVVAWIGTFLINYIWLTPAALHREQWTALEASRDETRSVNGSIEALRMELAAERENDKHPQIAGSVANFRCLGRRSTADFAVLFDAKLCNVRPVRTNLRRMMIDASEVLHFLTFSDCSAATVILDQGIAEKVEVRATLILDAAADPHDTIEVDLSALKVSALDGFGKQHGLRIAPGTMLFVDPNEPLAPDGAPF